MAKRLKRTSRGSYILPSGQRITPKEQRALKYAVANVNRKRREMIAKLPRQAKERYSQFGVESDFVIRKKSARFTRFRNKQEFNRYLKSIQNFNTTTYLNKRVSTYRDNLNRAIDKTFNSSGQPIKDFIKSLSNEELRELTLSESFSDIGYIYNEPISAKNKLDKLIKQVANIRKRNA